MTEEIAIKTRHHIRCQPWRGTYRVPADTDLLVNATSIGLYPAIDDMPPVDLSDAQPTLLVADAVFNPPETRFLAAARERGLPTLDGLSMLVYQGVIGCQLWTGQDPPEHIMKHALRTALGL
jgi:shikimate dehydrogenase